jgi:hypothetical protein
MGQVELKDPQLITGEATVVPVTEYRFVVQHRCHLAASGDRCKQNRIPQHPFRLGFGESVTIRDLRAELGGNWTI